MKQSILCLWIVLFMTGTSWAQPLKSQFRNVSANEAFQALQQNEKDQPLEILDLRTPAEFSRGHLAEAKLINYFSSDFMKNIQELDRSKTYLIYCQVGGRSSQALNKMKQLGFQHVLHMNHGFAEWQSQGLPVSR
ncbi:MAG: rhodanese-like domain-containing protein [SAR324 cluster bacterium]|nr:rhodanese-like domain-containing protein [SAR324 cluster bacterium]